MKNLLLSIFCCLMIWTVAPADSDLVVSVSPKGELLNLNDAGAIVVTFREAMVPLSIAPEGKGDGPLQIDPPVDGKFRWLGTRTLSFTPADTLPYASQFVVTVPAGVRSLSGNRLQKPVQWSFTTPRPRLLASHPEDRFSHVEPDQTFLLRFDQPMDPRRVGKSIALVDQEKNTSLPLEFQRPRRETIADMWSMGKDTTRILQVRPVKALTLARRYVLKINQGLLSGEGDLGSTKSTALQYETYSPLRYLGWSSRKDTPDAIVDPTSGIVFKFNNPVRPADLVDRLRFVPAVEIPDYYRDRDWGQNEIFLAVDLQPDTLYRVQIDADIIDIFGNRLAVAQTDSFRTDSYPERVTISSGPGVLEALGDRRFPVFFVNKSMVRLKMGHVPKDKLIELLTSEKSIFSAKTQVPEEWFLIDRPWRNDAPHNKRAISALQVDWLLAKQPFGLVLAEISDPADKHSAQRLLLQVTNLGISAKFSPHNNAIWVTRLDNTQPVVDAKVEIRDDQNRLLWQGTTDKSGLVETPGWKTLSLMAENEWSRPRQWIFVSHQGDFAYTASDWGTGIFPYRFGIDYEWNPQPDFCQGLMFTDRGLYRAGEAVFIKGIVRQKKVDSWVVPAAKPIRLSIRDSQGETVQMPKVNLSRWGSFDAKIQLNNNARLGYYWVAAETLATPSDTSSWREFLWSNFQVEAFRSAEFKVSAHVPAKNYVLGDSLRADFLASYLFGAPMAAQPISYRFLLTRGSFSPESFADYQFGPLGWGPGEQSELTSTVILQGNGRLDSLGRYQSATLLSALKCDFPLQLFVSADVEGPNQQVIGTVEQVQVHPASFYIGLKQSEFFIAHNRPVQCQVMTIQPDGKRISGKSVSLQLIRREWHAVRKAGIGGRYQWLNKTVDVQVDSAVVTTKQQDVEQAFSPERAGLYFIRADAVDERGNRTSSDVSFYVSGGDYVPWERSDDDRMDLIADRKLYAPGEVASIMVKSPFESAQALVTVEREKILAQKILTLKGSTPTITLPIEEGFLPNVFVSVILLKGRSADQMFSDEGQDVGKPAFKIGYVNLPVSPESKRLQVQIEPEKESYQPGDSVAVVIRVRDKRGAPVDAEVAFSAADAGVLSLIGYRLPDPFDAFYGMRPLSVQTSETRLHIVEQRNYGEKGENRGGGGADQGFSGAGLRRDFVASAYWNPSVKTGSDGHARVSFVAPDNLTTFALMAAAHSRDHRFGRGEAEFRTSKPLLMQLAMPRFLRAGDRCEAGVVVFNYTGKQGIITVEAEAENLVIHSQRQQQFSLAPGENRQVFFNVSAQNLGDATMRFFCRLGESQDAVENKIQVLESRRSETVALFQRTEESRQEKINVPDSIFADLSTITVTASASALSRISGPLSYLANYPYECLEQQVSRQLPLIVAGDLLREFELLPNDYRRAIQEWLDNLALFQSGDGGMRFWQDGDRSSPFVSVYTAYAMTRAAEKGFQIPNQVLQNLLDYIRDVLTERIDREIYPYDHLAWKSTELFALYVLTLNGRPDAGYVERFYPMRQSLPLLGRAYLLKIVHIMNPKDSRVEVLRQEIVNSVRVSPTTAYFADDEIGQMDWIYHSNVRSTALILQTLVEIGTDFPLYEQVITWLMEQQQNGHWATTQENVYALDAMAAYYQRFEKTPPNFTTRIRIAGQTLIDQLFDRRRQALMQSRLPLAKLAGKSIDANIDKQGAGSLYYSLRMTTFPRQAVEPRDEGLMVLKAMTPVPAANREFQLGDLVQVELTVVAGQERRYVVVQDPLPAGLEAIQLSFATTDQAARDAADDAGTNAYVFEHVEMHSDRVLIFADRLPAGVHRYTYFARATSRGTFSMPETTTEEMYHPEIYGRSTNKTIVIH